MYKYKNSLPLLLPAQVQQYLARISYLYLYRNRYNNILLSKTTIPYLYLYRPGTVKQYLVILYKDKNSLPLLVLAQVQQYLPCHLDFYKERQELPTFNCTSTGTTISCQLVLYIDKNFTFTCTGTGTKISYYLVMYKDKNSLLKTFSCTGKCTALSCYLVL